ncbi:MAG: sigma-54-dependent Fis family transcriptional regulator [Deltaproteobacteria bacterium]|nr:sigma-54-dependent Fis family transcriptional regulator [Candidatus Anaeroferrophillacea bacterium]
MTSRILIIDDEKLIRESLTHLLTGEGYRVDAAADGAEARELFGRRSYDLALIDLRLPDCSGIELLKTFMANAEDAPLCIMMTAYGSVDSAVEAMKEGAYDYLNKPFKSKEILLIVRLALEAGQLKREVKQIVGDQVKRYNIDNIIAVDPLMAKVFSVVRKVAGNRDVSVLVQGESGTGKELIAKAIHYLSDRADRPFVSINCASIPGNLLESELFGYERGAFTDAKARKQGLLEKAQGGSVFLDEIGDMDPSLQAKLLRVLEESRFRRLGSVSDISVDVRFISATNQALEKLIETGRFREDLYYRLKVINITIPPLRERKQDIEVLVKYFIDHFNSKLNKQVRGMSPEALRFLQQYAWPGNVRELKNCIERIMILEDTEVIGPEHLPLEVISSTREKGRFGVFLPREYDIRQGVDFNDLVRSFSSYLIEEAMKISGGNKARTARLLNMDRGTLRYQIRKLGIEE